MYAVRYLDGAERDLESLGRSEQRIIVAKIDWLAENAERIKHACLTGELARFHKLRVGDYRVLYVLAESERQIIVHKIGHRRDIYRKR